MKNLVEWRRATCLALTVCPLIALTDCSLTNNFTGAAAEYNLDAEQVQDQGLVLNIVRASYRRPLEFTGVQSLTGTQSAQAQVGMSIPLALNHSATPYTVSPLATLSGGPTVTINVLETQEFYQGILKPISLQTVDLYLQRGLPRTMLLNLLIQGVVAAQSEKGKTPTNQYEVSNYVGSDLQLNEFQRLAEVLLNQGLSTESVKGSKAYGPPLSADEVARDNVIAKTAAASLEISEVAWCDLSSEQRGAVRRRLGHGLDVNALDRECKKKDSKFDFPTFYQIGKPNTDYRFCFKSKLDAGPSQCGYKKPAEASSHSDAGEPSVKFAGSGPKKESTAGQIAICDAINEVRKESQPDSVLFDCQNLDNLPLTLSFKPRSTYGVIYYLGEIARRKLYPDSFSGGSRTVKVKLGPATTPIPVGDCTAPHIAPYHCEAIFDLHQPADDDAFISVSYDGKDYSLPREVKGSVSVSDEVLDVVAELLALNKSAKDLPASSVLTVVGQP